MYDDLILEHARHPRNFGAIPDPTVTVVEENPVCGDLVTLYLKISKGVIRRATFTGRGCAISQCAASLMTAHVVKRDCQDAVRFANTVVAMLRHGVEPDSPLPSDLAALCAVRKYPVRIKCALLPWNALLRGLKEVTPEDAV
ncbi:MAG: SUF system NifU family Fe-S cluster assembly protein [Calditrichaeota bacterium]|nr:MAG: SUF system NifU family Fe-S cluster assembly protein [Calditrichota bacterium]